jgi:hypothetical protein
MMNRIKALWSVYGRWFLLGLPVAALVIGLAASATMTTVTGAPKLLADAPTET